MAIRERMNLHGLTHFVIKYWREHAIGPYWLLSRSSNYGFR